jgi:hypothetical protein
MSQTLLGSICLTDIPKDKITVSEKNGKSYLNLVVFINDELDKFNNIASVVVSQSKEERDAKVKPSYIGNFKDSKSLAGKQLSPVEELVGDPLPF